ncbi:hypothetical protein B0H19DRAFT_706396 [Mycena capillaripes]|nr:hypothetical protein B0H19DRAFT_706396 [Mycena capillaripes]
MRARKLFFFPSPISFCLSSSFFYPFLRGSSRFVSSSAFNTRLCLFHRELEHKQQHSGSAARRSNAQMGRDESLGGAGNGGALGAASSLRVGAGASARNVVDDGSAPGHGPFEGRAATGGRNKPMNFLSLLRPAPSPPYTALVARIIKSADQRDDDLCPHFKTTGNETICSPVYEMRIFSSHVLFSSRSRLNTNSSRLTEYCPCHLRCKYFVCRRLQQNLIILNIRTSQDLRPRRLSLRAGSNPHWTDRD